MKRCIVNKYAPTANRIEIILNLKCNIMKLISIAHCAVCVEALIVMTSIFSSPVFYHLHQTELLNL